VFSYYGKLFLLTDSLDKAPHRSLEREGRVEGKKRGRKERRKEERKERKTEDEDIDLNTWMLQTLT
jgi:hypothetical protein